MASNRSAIKEMDASVIEGFENEGMVSQINSAREMVNELEMQAQLSEGPVFGDNVSMIKSMHLTQKDYLEKSEGMFGEKSQVNGLDRVGSQEEFFEGASGMNSFIDAPGSFVGNDMIDINKSNAELGEIHTPL
jgi:hypothetical protein